MFQIAQNQCWKGDCFIFRVGWDWTFWFLGCKWSIPSIPDDVGNNITFRGVKIFRWNRRTRRKSIIMPLYPPETSRELLLDGNFSSARRRRRVSPWILEGRYRYSCNASKISLIILYFVTIISLLFTILQRSSRQEICCLENVETSFGCQIDVQHDFTFIPTEAHRRYLMPIWAVKIQ
jgi:hypothetical protein